VPQKNTAEIEIKGGFLLMMNKHHKHSINIDDLDHRIYTALH